MNRKSFHLFLMALLAGLLFSACDEDRCVKGKGDIVTSTLDIASFTGIDAQGSFDVVIKQGATQSVTATGHPNIIDLLKTSVSGDMWLIDLDANCLRNYQLTIHITIPDLKQVILSGSGNIDVKPFIAQEDLAIDLDGSGNITLESFDGQGNLSIHLHGSGNITLGDLKGDIQRMTALIDGSGNLIGDMGATVQDLDIRIEGSGNYGGFGLATEQCSIRIEGSGDVEVTVNNSLDVQIIGSGDVRYKGRPTITQNITGSGRIIDAN